MRCVIVRHDVQHVRSLGSRGGSGGVCGARNRRERNAWRAACGSVHGCVSNTENSPALGAWGLGWEVWLDGQEITQFTYFQQAGSLNLSPVCVEITYGLERIILALQDKDSVWEMDYNDRIQYKDVFLQSEIEHCEYYFNVADVDGLKKVYETYEAESARCIEAGLVVPAHDYNLKCSHLFNILDTRGAIGVTERANYFKRMRTIARQISQGYVDQREKMGHPLLDEAWSLTSAVPIPPVETAVSQTGPQTFVLEMASKLQIGIKACRHLELP